MRTHLLLASLLLLLSLVSPSTASCTPSSGCSVALGNYVVSSSDTLSTIATAFQSNITSIQTYNQISDINSITPNQVLRIPFPCACSDDRLGYEPQYTILSGDTIDNVLHSKYSNLSENAWVVSANPSVNPNSLAPGTIINIPINCSCGNPDISTTYGLFLTYVVQAGDTTTSLSQKFSIQEALLKEYNGDVDFDNLVAYSDIIFVPAKDGNGDYPSYNVSADNGGGKGSDGNKVAVILGSIGGALLAVALAVWLYLIVVRKRSFKHLEKEDSVCLAENYRTGLVSVPVADSGEKVTEFSYDQLARSTNNFNVSNLIGSGGFGTVYYAEINQKKVAIKKMDISKSEQFKAEVQVLARVHHTNLVGLVGWCTERCLCLVYEFVENGTLRQHLEAPGAAPLTWASRVQIALETARGLEYIHEYTVPLYIHRDIKPDNILLDNNLHAKVADFGLAKLGEITGTTKNAGTQGYLSPEYVMGGILSPKLDVYAFGVVVMQLISAKRAIVFFNDTDRTSLPSLFENFLKEPNAKEKLCDFVDPNLKKAVEEDGATSDSVWKMVLLAHECTRFEPDERPDMQNVVLRISSLTSPQEWLLSGFNTRGGR